MRTAGLLRPPLSPRPLLFAPRSRFVAGRSFPSCPSPLVVRNVYLLAYSTDDIRPPPQPRLTFAPSDPAQAALSSPPSSLRLLLDSPPSRSKPSPSRLVAASLRHHGPNSRTPAGLAPLSLPLVNSAHRLPARSFSAWFARFFRGIWSDHADRAFRRRARPSIRCWRRWRRLVNSRSASWAALSSVPCSENRWDGRTNAGRDRGATRSGPRMSPPRSRSLAALTLLSPQSGLIPQIPAGINPWGYLREQLADLALSKQPRSATIFLVIGSVLAAVCASSLLPLNKLTLTPFAGTVRSSSSSQSGRSGGAKARSGSSASPESALASPTSSSTTLSRGAHALHSCC